MARLFVDTASSIPLTTRAREGKKLSVPRALELFPLEVEGEFASYEVRKWDVNAS